MRIFTDAVQIKTLLENRFTDVLRFPEHFSDERFNLDTGRSYTVLRPFPVRGISTLENKPTTVLVLPSSGEYSRFSHLGSTHELKPEFCIKGNHNIQLNEIKIVEHPISLMSAFGLFLDFELDQPSFPTFDFCNEVYLEGIRDNLLPLGERPAFTVNRPFAALWDKGYCVVEPDDRNSLALTLDHQVSYPGSSVGNTRIVAEIDPPLYAYIASARTTAFRPGEEAEKFHQIGLAGGLKDYPFTLENVILLNEERIFNPREKFAHDGRNFEFIAHELIDVLAWIRFVEEEYKGRFTGKVTTFLFDHHKQIDVSQFVCDRETFSEIGIQYL
ncbi:UDP-3-O-(3-hydroxymyristoyl)glucosamine N-acyltransferase [Leptospira gomenensis]|uniref:UDP-3-O-(3-hydroxymyristoyl)glucosamine N-acyltransferase n=1 Tax=Leptospira gomenensis TaxID=2484974 RepID=A0A5F1Z2G6_9LEPT|nr:UDP-3-O-acyl-N-acetylglucosamine deacetylase [Leptospira gomenensis]TGK28943.1 UDP-3-O-(3-hydroxymyristoyl)glucosamine N-acyltransferase [Leptospira gomenensis]TGK35404.1 UDP-3-O-(3-hydroxymyristoyl)glucosamine N-acyltransferase [Leptospira gomenensis]TGK40702.1 UDP-3-O-(3-hydroxymyristoyl)glucosamine N-acyltransferase [Leptospira gomenensis]TGK68454.1 UDP-3-O-(3-hydroxymyristoyl)glucosamine N-acyltransferase [Leptospira gomenensis]